MDHSPALYCRWHGSPREYWSSYDESWLRERAQWIQSLPEGQTCWCIFGNTAGGAAMRNALRLKAMLRDDPHVGESWPHGEPLTPTYGVTRN